MSFFFELVLTAFFSLLIASLLAKLFSPSSPSSSCHGSADVIHRGTHLSEKDKRERGRESEEVQQEKIIEVDKVVEKEAERGFLDEKERSGRDLSLKIEEKGDNNVLGDSDLIGEVEFEKEVYYQRNFEKAETFEMEKSCQFEKEKESCAKEAGHGKIEQNQLMEEHSLVADSYNLIFGEDQTILRQDEMLGEVQAELNDSVKEKDEKDNICEVQGSSSKITLENVETQNSLISQEERLENSVLSNEFEKGRDLQDNLNELEGPVSKIPKQEESITEALVLKKLEKKKETEEQEKNLSKTEGPTCKTTPFVEGTKEEREAAFNEEEEWEGIERSETEKRFSVTANYVTNDVLSKLTDEVQLKLYGLRKVATEGPCYESSSMALRASTRAKWHAWQRLGNMNPEMAMEQYMTLLSQNVPNLTGQPPNENTEENERGRSSEELKTYDASDQLTTESKEGLATSASESPN